MAFIPYYTRIQFDFGARKLLTDELRLLGVKRPLVMTDQGIVQCGLLEQALEGFAKSDAFALFDRVPANPTLDMVEAALAVYRDEGCDGLVAVGGGSVIDAAKAVALLATHPGPLEQYRVDRDGMAHIGPGVAPLVTVPTTAGTGSEIGRGMGIGLCANEPKGVFLSPNLMPKAAICDPELTLGLPPRMTAGSGIDAFSHCLEGYLSPALNPPLDAVALDAIARIAEHLPRAVADGTDREARWHMMMGAVEGGMCMWKGLGPAHALSMPLDTLDLHHGTVVGVLLPHTVRFLSESVQAKLERLAVILNAGSAANVPDWLAGFNRRIGLPGNLREMGVTEPGLAAHAEGAAQSVFNRTSARSGSAGDYHAMLREAMQ